MPHPIYTVLICCTDSRSSLRRSRLPSVPECIMSSPLPHPSTPLYYQQAPLPPPAPPLAPPPPPGGEDPRTWLERQKMKLVSRRADGVGSGGRIGLAGPPGIDPERAEQQRRLLEELKSAQSILMRRRAETVPDTDDDQRQQTTPNGIHVDKPQVHTADAVWSKKPRSQLPAAADSAKVYFDSMLWWSLY